MKALLLTTASAALICGASPALAQTGQAQQPAAGSPGSRDAAPGTIDTVGGSAPTQGSPGQPDVQGTTGQLQDIVVTAQRREESLQRAAVSVTAISNATLVNKGITDITQLTQLAPALRAIEGQGAYVNYALRGINNFASNSFADSAIVVNTNGVPLAHPTGAHGLFYDVERVEVLKGPQGTLYGRNATGGAVNVISAKPTDTFGGYANLEVGNYAKVLGTAALNVPITDDLAIRFAGQAVRRDGFFKDGTGDEKAQAGRVSLRYKPGSKLTINLIGDFSHEGGAGTGSSLISNRTAIGGSPTILHFVGGDPYAGTLNQDPAIQGFFTPFSKRRTDISRQNDKFFGVTGTIDYSTSLGTLTLIPSYRGTRVSYVSDLPTFYLAENQRTNQHSAELRLSSSADHAIRYLIGGFYLYDSLHSQYLTENQPTAAADQFINTTDETAAAFGQITWAIVPTFRLTGGARYTWEEKTTDSIRRDLGFLTDPPVNFATFDFNNLPSMSQGYLRFTTTGDISFRKTTWKAGAEWDVGARSLLYANVGTGFKAGGFYFGPAGANTYLPETVTAYTIGSKNRFLGNTLQVNAEGFYYKYKNQQVSHFKVFPAPFGNIFVTDNAGDATIYGAEVEAELLITSNTKFRFQGQYLHGQYDRLTYLSPTSTTGNATCASPAVAGGYQIDCSGKPMLYSPKYIISEGVDQTFPLNNGGSIVFSADSRFESSRETQLNYLPETRAAAYTKTDLSLSYNAPGNRLTATLWVQNVEDAAVISSTQVGRNYTIANSGLISAYLQAPRTFGGRVGVKF